MTGLHDIDEYIQAQLLLAVSFLLFPGLGHNLYDMLHGKMALMSNVNSESHDQGFHHYHLA